MSLSKKLAKRAAFLRETTRRVPWQGIRRLHDPGADLVIWIHHRYPTTWAEWLLRADTVLKDVALTRLVVEQGRKFRFVVGPSIGDVTNSEIIYSIDRYNPSRVKNYSAGLVAALRALEAQGNVLYPSADEAEWWENKVFMHRRFDELGISTPETLIVERDTELDADSLTYPLLVKEPHSSGSLGLHKVDSPGELLALRSRLEEVGMSDLLVQRLLDIRRDLRCTIIGGEIVHHYFRISSAPEWKPTATSGGSTVDFHTFPGRWRTRILDAFARTGLRSGAFDICWDGDDLETEPYFLEVTPTYQANPPAPPAFADRPYVEFKATTTGADSFQAAYADLVLDLHRKMFAAWELAPQPATRPAEPGLARA